MFLIQWQIFRDIFWSTLVICGVLTFLFLSVDALRDVISLVAAGRVGLSTVIELFGLLLPYTAAFALPMGILAATLLVFGRMSANRELIALRAAGMGYGTILAPVVIFIALGVGLSLLINLEYAPSARAEYRRMLGELVRTNPTQFFTPKQFVKDFPGFVIYVGEREDAELRDFWIWQLDEDGSAERVLRAETGTLLYDDDRGAIIIELEQASAEVLPQTAEGLRSGERAPLFTVGTTIELPLDQVLRRGESEKKIKRLTGRELVKVHRALDAGEPSPIPLRGEVSPVDLRAQFQENVAKSFAPLSLGLLAIPLAIRVGRKETYTHVAIAIGLSLAYYFTLVLVGMARQSIGDGSELLMWLPNVLFQGIGAYLVYRLFRS
ncbi:MAG: LptF/LptG family permease [Verrucomicrobiota bacterium]